MTQKVVDYTVVPIEEAVGKIKNEGYQLYGNPIIHSNDGAPVFYQTLIKREEPEYQVKNRVRLTEMQEQVLFFTKGGMTAKEIAYKLQLCKGTIDYHLRSLKQKLHCENKFQLLRLAMDWDYSFEKTA